MTKFVENALENALFDVESVWTKKAFGDRIRPVVYGAEKNAS